MPALVICGWFHRPEVLPSIAGITARPALAKALRSHYVRLKSALDNPPLQTVGMEAISL
jgi:hypothetical protein